MSQATLIDVLSQKPSFSVISENSEFKAISVNIPDTTLNFGADFQIIITREKPSNYIAADAWSHRTASSGEYWELSAAPPQYVLDSFESLKEAAYAELNK